jgi:hypothetical protein
MNQITAILFWGLTFWRNRAQASIAPRSAKACEAALFAALRNFCAKNGFDLHLALRTAGVDEEPPAICIAPDPRYQGVIETALSSFVARTAAKPKVAGQR